jgi:hypothetical protein
LLIKSITLKCGAMYIGEHKNGQPNGLGTVTYSDGRKYSGLWQDGQPCGQGTLTYEDETTYVGDIENGQPDGYGRMTYRDGSEHIGGWENGQPHGHGILVSANGYATTGVFEEGKERVTEHFSLQSIYSVEKQSADAFCHNMRRIMLEKSITYSGLSKLTGIGIGGLNEYVNKKHAMKLEYAVAISKALGFTVGEMLMPSK